MEDNSYAELRLKRITELIAKYGHIDGDHHKKWLLDTIVRIALDDAESYREWRQQFIETETNYDGSVDSYDHWDIGIAS